MAETQDTYYTIDVESTGEYKEKGSKFVCYLFPVRDEDDFAKRMEALKKEHLKARHHCFGYRIGYEGERYRSSDDGEPSGTAGKPIFGQLIKTDLTFVGAIVVRYFGGTKLGTSGLIQAYRDSTAVAIANATILTKTRTATLLITFNYENMGKAMKVVKDCHLEISETDFGNTPRLFIEVPYSEIDETIIRLKAKYLNRVVEDVSLEDSIEHFTITPQV